jgi:tight adherence protein C
MESTATSFLIRYCAVGLFGGSLALLAHGLWRLPRLEPPTTGLRGEMRKRALEAGSPLRSCEPVLLLVGGWVRALGWLPFRPWQRAFARYVAWQEQQLTLAGRAAGLDAFELSALALCLAAGAGVGVSLGALGTGNGAVWVIPAAALGLALPNLRLQSITADRFKAATRSLPASIDLAALCMSAGSDFTQALRYIVQGSEDLIAEELGRVLHALEVGHTRRAALLELAERLPVEPVRDLVRALVQAEERGNPLAEALHNQARMSRMRRSVAAEEAAARAGVLMVLPMMLLMGCVVLLLLGPFFVTGGGL